MIVHILLIDSIFGTIQRTRHGRTLLQCAFIAAITFEVTFRKQLLNLVFRLHVLP